MTHLHVYTLSVYSLECKHLPNIAHLALAGRVEMKSLCRLDVASRIGHFLLTFFVLYVTLSHPNSGQPLSRPRRKLLV